MMPQPSPRENIESFDQIAADLQMLRESAGAVSYAEIVRLITDVRLRRGVSEAASVPARSTVYNAFQSGRTRLDGELLRDIVMALGVTQDDAETWVQRSRNARRDAELRVKREAVATNPITPTRSTFLHAIAPRPSVSLVAMVLLGCVVANLAGLSIANIFKLSVYLDMVGTAIAAIVLGPWHGVGVAIATNALGFLAGDPATVPFMPANVAGALLWGYGIRRFRMGTTLSRYLMLNLLTGLGVSLVAAPIVVAVFHGGAGHASELAVLSLEAMQLPFIASVFSTNLITSIVDKLLTGFIALAVFTLLHKRVGLSAAHMPLVGKLGAMQMTASEPKTHSSSVLAR